MGKVIMSGVSKGMTVPATFDRILNNNTWEQIRAASDAGIASTLWKVGDCKEITLNGKVGNSTFSNYRTYAYIIGFDHNAEVEGSNRIHFQIGKTALADGVDIALCDGKYNSSTNEFGYFLMNNGLTNSGGWALSQMRTKMCGTSLDSYDGTFLGVIPDDLRTALKPVTKYTNNNGSTSAADAITETIDYFFLLSEYEIYGSISSGNPNEASKQKQYDYYSAGNSKVKYRHDSISTSVFWWLRSPVSNQYSQFVNVHIDGTVNGSAANYSAGFTPCFCV